MAAKTPLRKDVSRRYLLSLALTHCTVRWTQRLHSDFVSFHSQLRLRACPQPRPDLDASPPSYLDFAHSIPTLFNYLDIDRHRPFFGRPQNPPSNASKPFICTYQVSPTAGTSIMLSLDYLIFTRPLILTSFQTLPMAGATRRHLRSRF
jgi:hypothetical protein